MSYLRSDSVKDQRNEIYRQSVSEENIDIVEDPKISIT